MITVALHEHTATVFVAYTRQTLFTLIQDTASSEPWQQEVWVYTTPTYHVVLITILPTSFYWNAVLWCHYHKGQLLYLL